LLEALPWIRAGWCKLYFAVKKRGVLNGNLYKRLDISGSSAGLVVGQCCRWGNGAGFEVKSRPGRQIEKNLEIHDRYPESNRMR